MQLLLSCYMVADAPVVEYVLVSKLETFLPSRNSNWWRFPMGLYSVSAPSRKLIPIDCGASYKTSQVEKCGCRHWRFRVKVHTVQLTKLPHPHSRGVHRLHGLMATIATTGPSRLLQITYPAQCSGPTTALPGGFMCICWHLPTVRGPLPTHFSRTIQISYCMSICLAGSWLSCYEIASNTSWWCRCWPEPILHCC